MRQKCSRAPVSHLPSIRDTRSSVIVVRTARLLNWSSPRYSNVREWVTPCHSPQPPNVRSAPSPSRASHKCLASRYNYPRGDGRDGGPTEFGTQFD
nr:Biomphalaria glabrata protocadherin gamma-B4-like; transcript variant X2 [Biomphalaria glabrata]